MSQALSVAFAANNEDNLAGASANPSDRSPDGNVSLRGTTRGLEILISGAPSTAALGSRLTELLAEAPGFFAGSSARVAIDGALPSGALACLEEVTTRFEVQIVEISPVATKRRRSAVPPILRPDDVPQVHLAEGTGPIAEEAVELRGGEPGEGPSATPALSVDAAPSDATSVAAREAGAIDVESTELTLSDDAAPLEVELANTAPFGVARAEASAVTVGSSDAMFVEATPVADVSSSAIAMDASAVTVGSSDAVLVEAAPVADVSSSAITMDASAVAVGSSDAALVGAAPVTAAPSETVGSSDAVLVEGAASLASGSGAAPPSAAAPTGPIPSAAPLAALATALATEVDPARPIGPRLVIGPVRSGVIVDHQGHVIVIGDVNPGAEVRAEGSIIVLGRLRGVAHAAIGRDAGCIIALSLAPQQLRIGRVVARAGDADRPSDGAEIAYATGETIVVERFLGRLPSGLAASM